MQITSEAYKSEQKEHLRNEQYVRVYLGVVSREAQSNAVAEGDFTIFSNPEQVTFSMPFEAYYETAEQNLARTDGSQFFMPRDPNLLALYQGAVTESIKGTIRFTFGEYKKLNLKGLTIDFGDFFPTKFTVSNGYEANTYTYENEDPGLWSCEDEFLNTEFLEITPITMIGGNQRLRILSISFGKGFTFDNWSLISTSWKSEVAHLSDTLPTKSFTFTIDNLSRNFSADNPHSWVAFLQEQQEVRFEYGRHMDDDSVFVIPGGNLRLKSWSSTDTQAKFTAVGNLDYITTTYTKGRYYENGVSLYDLAVDVCQDAGIEKYRIDSYLKEVKTHNPLPVETHKNLLQLIANAARCILFEDRDGTITLKTSFMPDITDVTDNGHTDYSYLDGLFDDDFIVSEYGTAEKNFTYADAHQYFIPRSSTTGYLYAGYVSSRVSNNKGEFSGTSSNYMRFVTDSQTITGIQFEGEVSVDKGCFVSENGIIVDFNEETTSNPFITIDWEASWTFYDMTLVFSDVYPKKLVVYAYNAGEQVKKIAVNTVKMSTLIKESFIDVDSIKIEFIKTGAYQRIHLAKILFGDISDYVLEYTDMSESPTAKRTDFIKNVNVVYSEYAYGSEVKNISTVAVVGETNTASYRVPYHNYSVAYKELKDDETTYTKVSKVFCDELPAADTAKSSTRYFVRKSSGYDMYVQKTENAVKSWDSLGHVTEQKVNSLPSTLSSNVLYLVYTTTNLIYHLYMLDDTASTPKTISLGYDVRGTLNITDSGAYYVTFTSNVASPVVVSGIAFLVNERTYTSELHELGIDKTATNVLIDNEADAINEADWLTEHFNNDIEYRISYRGEPALDPDDQIYLENRFVEKNLVRITSTQIDTSTGMSMSCILNARRISYMDDDIARVDYAIVDVSEVGK